MDDYAYYTASGEAELAEALEEIAPFLAVFAILLGVLLLWGIVSYIIRSLSLYRLGKSAGISAYGLAWVPVAYAYCVGAIADKYDAKGGRDHQIRKVMTWLLAVSAVFGVLFLVNYTAFIAQIVALGGEPELGEMMRMLWSFVLPEVPMCVAATGVSAVSYICYYKIFELCKPEKPVKNLLIAILVPFAFPFVLLSCAKAYPPCTVELLPQVSECGAADGNAE